MELVRRYREDWSWSEGTGRIRAGQKVQGGLELVRRYREDWSRSEGTGRIGAGQKVQRR